jgi:hypothetical protein
VIKAQTLPVQQAKQVEAGTPSKRFVQVFGGKTIEDTLSGLVWEQAPDSFHRTWSYRPLPGENY